MSRALFKQIGLLAGYITIPLAIVIAIGLIAVRRFEWYIIVGLALLLLCVAIFAATNPAAWQRRLGRQRVSSVISGVVIIAALVGIIALINVLFQRTTVQFDLTRGQNFTVSDTTVQVLQKLEGPVTATIFYNRETQDQQNRAADTLKQYSARTDKLSVQSINADVDPITAARYNLKTVPTVVFEQQNRREEVTSIDEQSFTRALLRLQNPISRRVLVVTGHQELSPQANQSGSSLSVAVQALTTNNYKVELYNSATGTSTPAGQSQGATPPATTPTTVELNPANDILLIAGPRGRFSDDEKRRFTTFLKQGGKALVAYDIAGNVDAAQATNVNDLLADWGVKFNRGLVVERDPTRRTQNPAELVPNIVAGSEVTRGLENQNIFVLQATTLEKDAASTATYTELLRTSTESYLKVKLPPQTAEFEQGDTRGPLVVAATVEEKAREAAPPVAATPATTPGATLAVPGATPTAAPTATPAASTGQTLNTRLVLLGSPTAINDLVLSQSRSNYDFFVNAMNYLNESASSVVIPSRIADTRPFSINESQSSLAFWSSFLGLPLLILFLGLAAWWRRR